MFAMSVGLLAALYFLVQRTELGRAIRAVAEDKEAASLMGVNVNRIVSTVFFIGPGLGGACGVLYSMWFNEVRYAMGASAGNKGWISAIVGGIGNIWGSGAGGMILGLLETFGGGYLPTITRGLLGSEYKEIFAFTLLIIVLIFRPQGLFGEPVRQK